MVGPLQQQLGLADWHKAEPGLVSEATLAAPMLQVLCHMYLMQIIYKKKKKCLERRYAYTKYVLKFFPEAVKETE